MELMGQSMRKISLAYGIGRDKIDGTFERCVEEKMGKGVDEIMAMDPTDPLLTTAEDGSQSKAIKEDHFFKSPARA